MQHHHPREWTACQSAVCITEIVSTMTLSMYMRPQGVVLDLPFLLPQGESGSQVNLVIPWLAPADQAKVFPNNLKFDTPADQEKYVREWAAKRTGFDCNFKVLMPAARVLSHKTIQTLPFAAQRSYRLLSQWVMYLVTGHLLPWAVCQGERQHPASGRPHAVHPSRRGALLVYTACSVPCNAVWPSCLQGTNRQGVAHTGRLLRPKMGRLTRSSLVRSLMQADVAVLEEPEHLTWYHHGTRWTDKFNHVVGSIQWQRFLFTVTVQSCSR